MSRARRRSGGWFAGAVGLLGELLITAGVVLGLFVVWQLWWTDVQSERTQQERIAELGWAEPPVSDVVAELAVDGAPVLAEPGHGTTFATLSVPRWGEEYQQPITQGVDRRTVLDPLGVGHYPDTAMPGQVGNFSLAAHRTTYGKPFNRVADLEVGDPLVVRTEDAWYVYRVTSWLIVDPDQVEVIAPVPGEPGAAPSRPMITLTTCHPMYSAAERWIVHGELEGWSAVADGTPTVLMDGVGTPPGGG